MKMSTNAIAGAVLLALIGSIDPARAASAIDEKRQVDAEASIDINNVRGRIAVTAWDREEVVIGGTLGEGAKLDVAGGGHQLSIRVQSANGAGWSWWGGSGPSSDTVLEIKVPVRAKLDITAVSADVEVRGIDGARDLLVESVSGSQRIDARAQHWELSSVSGDIDARGAASGGSLETVSGDVTATGLSGDVSFETVSGRGRLEAAKLVRLNANTVSGDLDFTVDPAQGGRIDVESMSGDVSIFVPEGISSRIEAESFSGRISSDFGKVVEEDHGPGSKLRATVGAGDATINLESFSGDLNVRRR